MSARTAAAVVIHTEVRPHASKRDYLAGLEQRLSADRTPSWSGLRLLLGAGQAPFDDAPYSNSILPESARGFSDTLIQLEVEDRLTPGLSLIGVMAASRHQDEPLLTSLEDAEFAWVTVGLRWSF